MIFRAFESKIYEDYQNIQGRRGRFQDYLHRLKTQEYNNLKKVLYTKAPTQRGKVDAVFRIKSEQTLRRALIWRKRTMAYTMENNSDQCKISKSTCINCQVDFNEGHINQ